MEENKAKAMAREGGNAGPSEHQSPAHDIVTAARNTLKLGASLMITWLLALVVKLRVPVQLGPVLQGQFAFAESFAAMFFGLIGFGIETYIIKEISIRPNHASDFVGGIFVLRSIVSTLLFACMGVLLSVTHRTAEVQLAVAVFGLTYLVSNFNGTFGALLQASTHVGGLARANVVGKVAWAIGLLVGLHYRVPLFVLAMPMLASEILRTLLITPAAKNAVSLQFRIDVAAVRKVVVASLPYFVNTVTVGLVTNLAMSTLEFIRKDEREVGWFSATQNLASLTMILSPVITWIVMPLLARAQARSSEEALAILRRCIEGLVVTIAPITVAISASSPILLRLVLGEKYVPASVGLSILSLVFVVTYLNIILATALIVVNKSWSVTIISLLGTLSLSVFMLVFVPVGRRLLGTGGECAGAAAAVIANEACVILALLWRMHWTPMDRRNVSVVTRTVIVCLVSLVLDHFLTPLGPVRLAIDVVVYITLALAIGAIRPKDVAKAISIIRSMKGAAPAPPAQAT